MGEAMGDGFAQLSCLLPGQELDHVLAVLIHQFADQFGSPGRIPCFQSGIELSGKWRQEFLGQTQRHFLLRLEPVPEMQLQRVADQTQHEVPTGFNESIGHAVDVIEVFDWVEGLVLNRVKMRPDDAELRVAPAPDSDRDAGREKMGADLEDLLDQLAVRHLVEIQQVADDVHARVIETPDPGTGSRDLDQPLLGQGTEPFANGSAMDLELLGQLPLRTQTIPSPVSAGEDVIAKALGYALGGGLGHDSKDPGGAGEGVVRPVWSDHTPARL